MRYQMNIKAVRAEVASTKAPQMLDAQRDYLTSFNQP